MRRDPQEEMGQVGGFRATQRKQRGGDVSDRLTRPTPIRQLNKAGINHNITCEMSTYGEKSIYLGGPVAPWQTGIPPSCGDAYRGAPGAF